MPDGATVTDLLAKVTGGDEDARTILKQTRAFIDGKQADRATPLADGAEVTSSCGRSQGCHFAQGERKPRSKTRSFVVLLHPLRERSDRHPLKPQRGWHPLSEATPPHLMLPRLMPSTKARWKRRKRATTGRTTRVEAAMSRLN